MGPWRWPTSVEGGVVLVLFTGHSRPGPAALASEETGTQVPGVSRRRPPLTVSSARGSTSRHWTPCVPRVRGSPKVRVPPPETDLSRRPATGVSRVWPLIPRGVDPTPLVPLRAPGRATTVLVTPEAGARTAEGGKGRSGGGRRPGAETIVVQGEVNGEVGDL